MLLLAGLLVPPWISFSRYQGKIAQLISASLGRPVRISSVQLRLLPRPGFLLGDLTVAEEPAYGAEPVLHADSVTADIRLLSLWRGRLAIGQISVDDASLNLVRSSSGRWNIEELFRSAAQSHGAVLTTGRPLPYLEASESRINIKDGLEKLPYSLVNADIELWQDQPGQWHIRLSGQPARTDVSLDLADTGILQIEGSLRQASQLRKMPVHLEMEWRDAQLGQLSRLVIGSDPGWRGDLRGNLKLDGTAESAKVQMRLRANGVHRAEFAPAAPLDFDANCSFVYLHSARSVDKLACNSPLGDGQVHLTGSIHTMESKHLQIQLQRIPVQAGLDLLRTLRSGIDNSLQAAGSVSGELTYSSVIAPGSTAQSVVVQHPSAQQHARERKGKDLNKASLAPVLTGSLTADGFKLTGNSLEQPIEVKRMVLEADSTSPGRVFLTASIALPAGGETPLNLGAKLSWNGYSLTMHGPAAFARLRQFAQVVGADQFAIIDNVAGEPAILDLDATGPWLPPEESSSELLSGPDGSNASILEGALENQRTDQLLGTITLHNANWKTSQLASPVELAQAVVHFSPDGWLVSPLQFVYGPLKGSGNLEIKSRCDDTQACAPSLNIQFDTLNAATVQEALLGARKEGSVLGDLLARWTSVRANPWPLLDLTVQANALALGPIQLQKARAELHVEHASADVTGLDAGLFGGQLHASGTITQGDKPKYSIEGTLDGASAAAICQFLGLHCAGGPFSAQGSVETSGFSGADLASAAKGTIHYEWRRGTVSKSGTPQVPAALTRFTQWSGDADISQGSVVLGENEVMQGKELMSVAASIPLTAPPRIHFTEKPAQATSAKP